MIAPALVVAALVSASAPAPASRERVLVLEFATVEVQREEAAILEDAVSEALARRDALEVMSAADLRRLVEVETQKQLVGCDDASCLAEIAGALGARYIAFGRVARLSSVLVVQLNLFDATQAAPVARTSFEARDLADARAHTPRAVDELVAPLGLTPLPDDGPSWPLLGAGLGVGLAGGLAAAAGAGLALAFTSTLTTASSPPADKQTAIDWWWAPWTAVGVGAAAVAAGAAVSTFAFVE